MSDYKKVWPPLGLPTGSVRALLTLLIVAVVIVQTVRGQEIEILWAETLMIAMAHYFTTRRFLNLPPDVIRRLAKEGHVEPEANPLFLPRFSIRLILLAIFAGLGLAGARNDFASAGILVLGVFSGSALWWFILCQGVGMFRDRFNPRALQWVNRISGAVILGFGLYALSGLL